MIAVGLMSGTSLDGIDAVLVRIEPSAESYAFDILAFDTVPFEPELADALRMALPPHGCTVATLAQLHHRLGNAFARAARHVAGELCVDYVASHGQTIWHDGPAHTSVQIGDAFVIREAMNATVCFDFRSGDCAVGGHGAPLVPYVDALLFTDVAEDRIALNLGGIANITAIPAGSEPHDVLAFDTGPGNMLIDAFVRERTDARCDYDVDGAFAQAGTANAAALESMLQDTFFYEPVPKTTGREHFGSQFLDVHDAVLRGLSLEDGCATLGELTSITVAAGVARAGLENARILCSGGGVKNRDVMRRLAQRLPRACVETTDRYGVPADAKEAVAFAILGYETLRERATNVPRVTGASRAVPLGAIAPARLPALLAQIERQCRSS
ncbi:MAG: anhydro-N-acetylmuramic acid kinase [Candidatus Eremiobacteraeota bacterium]|nr:anhydro-N-acetylmuramic acid kinase [Candidatus Eremiobacteraeota bacterium]